MTAPDRSFHISAGSLAIIDFGLAKQPHECFASAPELLAQLAGEVVP